MKYLIASLLLSALLFIGCTEEKINPGVAKVSVPKELPTQESFNSRISFTDTGKTKAVLIAGHIAFYDVSMETILDKEVKVDFYDENQVKTTTLTSHKGRVDDRTKDLFAIDNVVVVNDSGMVLKTEKLQYRNRDRKIVSDDFVTITTPNEEIKGFGFESDQGLKNYKISKIIYVTDVTKLK